MSVKPNYVLCVKADFSARIFLTVFAFQGAAAAVSAQLFIVCICFYFAFSIVCVQRLISAAAARVCTGFGAAARPDEF